MDRRQFSIAAGAAVLGMTLSGCAQKMWGNAGAEDQDSAAWASERLRGRFEAIEAASGGRLGVTVLDTHTGARYGYRGAERFPMCSTFKLLVAGYVLKRVDEGKEMLDRRIRFSASDLIEYSPTTGKHVGGEGMRIADLCLAMVTLSDNTAANLLLASFGGPPQLTAFIRSLGDAATRLDRIEPALNESIPDDPRDTTTPDAMLWSMQALVLGQALSPASRTQIKTWLVGNKTGDKRLRAGLPANWEVGDKTGSGSNGSTNDVAVIWPPGRGPILVTSYLTQTTAAPEVRDRALADVGRLVAAMK